MITLYHTDYNYSSCYTFVENIKAAGALSSEMLGTSTLIQGIENTYNSILDEIQGLYSQANILITSGLVENKQEVDECLDSVADRINKLFQAEADGENEANKIIRPETEPIEAIKIILNTEKQTKPEVPAELTSETTQIQTEITAGSSGSSTNALGTAENANENNRIYVITVSGERYHYPSCRTVNQIKEYVTLQEANDKGYTSCGVCNPPKYNAQSATQPTENLSSMTNDTPTATAVAPTPTTPAPTTPNITSNINEDEIPYYPENNEIPDFGRIFDIPMGITTSEEWVTCLYNVDVMHGNFMEYYEILIQNGFVYDGEEENKIFLYKDNHLVVITYEETHTIIQFTKK